MEYATIISGLLGGAIVALAQYILNKRKELYLNLNRINEGKYRSILVHMACALDYNNRDCFSIDEEFVGKSKEDYLKRVEQYYYHSLLYSPDFVIEELKKFIRNPDKESYIKTAKAMRKDLWGKKTKLEEKDIIIR